MTKTTPLLHHQYQQQLKEVTILGKHWNALFFVETMKRSYNLREQHWQITPATKDLHITNDEQNKSLLLHQLFIVTHSFLQDFVTNWLDHSSVSVSLTSRNTCSLFVCFSVPSSTTYIYYIYCILLHFYVEYIYIYIFYTSSSFNHDDYRDNDKEDDSVFWCQWTQP